MVVFRPRNFPPYVFVKGVDSPSEGMDTILSEGVDSLGESRKIIFLT